MNNRQFSSKQEIKVARSVGKIISAGEALPAAALSEIVVEGRS